MRVKICGITNVADAAWAIDNGADAIGFVFAESPRRISREQARKIRSHVPPFVSVVGIFVEPDPQEARELIDAIGLDYVQLYGKAEEGFLQVSGLNPGRLIRTVSVGSEADLADIGPSVAQIILLDTKVEGMAGGTGKVFDWKIAAKAKQYGRRVILSGGLNPDNVSKAIETASPDAVDTSSGVESAPGKKDPEKVREFIRRAKGYVT